MGKRGPKPKGKVKIKWSPKFAYAIGLLVSDGNLSPDGRHIVFVSKDYEMIELFQESLGIDIHIGKKANGTLPGKPYFVAQFSDVLFYKFLMDIGLMPNKSKVIGDVKIPDSYFFDFLRGFSMAMGLRIHISTLAGGRVICSTLVLYQQALTT